MRQPTRRLSDDRRQAVLDELAKLLAAGFIMEVLHPDWISNPVLVEKKKDKPAIVKVWRMCIDFTNLNKACPKDPFPLPRIDQVIDSTVGCELLSFIDAYSGFHQIPLNQKKSNKDCLYYPLWGLLLSCHVLWFEKCWCHLSEMHAEVLAVSNG